MAIVEKEGILPVFNIDILNTFFFFLPTAEITAWLTGKIGTNLPTAEGLKNVTTSELKLLLRTFLGNVNYCYTGSLEEHC